MNMLELLKKCLKKFSRNDAFCFNYKILNKFYFLCQGRVAFNYMGKLEDRIFLNTYSLQENLK